MSRHDFEKQLRNLLRREPFEPFIVLVNDGRTSYVDEPTIAFGGGRAGFIGPDRLVEFFDCDNVLGFRPGNQETAR